MRKDLTNCPSCKKDLIVKELECTDCKINIRGDFSLNEFASLSSEDLVFLRAFVSSRGNIKEIERKLGISYPTVKSRMEELLLNLGYTTEEDRTVSQKEILDMLDNGEINAKEASELLRRKNG